MLLFCCVNDYCIKFKVLVNLVGTWVAESSPGWGWLLQLGGSVVAHMSSVGGVGSLLHTCIPRDGYHSLRRARSCGTASLASNLLQIPVKVEMCPLPSPQMHKENPGLFAGLLLSWAPLSSHFHWVRVTSWMVTLSDGVLFIVWRKQADADGSLCFFLPFYNMWFPNPNLWICMAPACPKYLWAIFNHLWLKTSPRLLWRQR